MIFLFACDNQRSKSLTIATAANMQFAMEALTEAFSEESQVTCALVVSSSGKLTAQIKAGAPYDVFVSADVKYPEALYQSGLTEGAAKVYAHGKLVLWSMLPELQPSIELLQSPSVQHIALANPKTAPYGAAALSVLQRYNLQDSVKEKLVYGESIAQTNRFINSKSVELGFTALSVVRAERMQGVGQWIELDTNLYQPIAQAAVVLQAKEGTHPAAISFYKFLFSAKAKKILKDFGYLVDE
ncbi:MAG: molybdate ABC transporter substrate-binding protein [Saprospiraceae bacterium]